MVCGGLQWIAVVCLLVIQHRTHSMDNGWIMHKSFTSRRRLSNNIRNDIKALPRDTLGQTPFIIVTPMNLTCVVCADAFRIATCSDSIYRIRIRIRVRIRTHGITPMRLHYTYIHIHTYISSSVFIGHSPVDRSYKSCLNF